MDKNSYEIRFCELISASLTLSYSTAITDSRYFARHCVPSSTAVTDSLDFQVADAPLQIQFASASTAVTNSLDFRVADAPLTNPVRIVQIMFAMHRFAQEATAPAALRVVDCPTGDKVYIM